MGKGMAEGDKPGSTCMSGRKCSGENEFSISPDSEDTSMQFESFPSLLRYHSSISIGKKSNAQTRRKTFWFSWSTEDESLQWYNNINQAWTDSLVTYTMMVTTPSILMENSFNSQITGEEV